MKYILTFCVFCICLLGLTKTYAQGGVRGSVLDKETGEPIIGAYIFLNDGTYSTITNIDGEYILTSVKKGSYNLNIRYLGYDSIQVPISINKKIISQNFQLQEASQSIGMVEISASPPAAGIRLISLGVI